MDLVISQIHFYFSLVCFTFFLVSGLIVRFAYYHFKTYPAPVHSTGLLRDLADVIPASLMNTLFAAWVYVGSVPLFNRFADKMQYGSLLGSIRSSGMTDERPWYGIGEYQFLLFCTIVFAGLLVSWVRHKNKNQG